MEDRRRCRRVIMSLRRSGRLSLPAPAAAPPPDRQPSSRRRAGSTPSSVGGYPSRGMFTAALSFSFQPCMASAVSSAFLRIWVFDQGVDCLFTSACCSCASMLCDWQTSYRCTRQLPQQAHYATARPHPVCFAIVSVRLVSALSLVAVRACRQ